MHVDLFKSIYFRPAFSFTVISFKRKLVILLVTFKVSTKYGFITKKNSFVLKSIFINVCDF